MCVDLLTPDRSPVNILQSNSTQIFCRHHSSSRVNWLSQQSQQRCCNRTLFLRIALSVKFNQNVVIKGKQIEVSGAAAPCFSELPEKPGMSWSSTIVTFKAVLIAVYMTKALQTKCKTCFGGPRMILHALWKNTFFKKAVWFFHYPRWPPAPRFGKRP